MENKNFMALTEDELYEVNGGLSIYEKKTEYNNYGDGEMHIDEKESHDQGSNNEMDNSDHSSGSKEKNKKSGCGCGCGCGGSGSSSSDSSKSSSSTSSSSSSSKSSK